jgi:hypothetical protein
MSTYRNINTSAHIAADDSRRRRIRYAAAFLAALTALIYFLIGFRVLIVLDANADQIFGLFAGAAYALGALLLLTVDRGPLWILGAVLQVFVIYTYFNLASQRTPAFEIWGILLRVAQVLLLLALVYLAVRPAANQSS